MAESGGRAVERKLTLPVTPAAAAIGVKPAFSGRSLADGANADFDVVVAAPDGKPLAQAGLHYELLRVETRYQWYRQNGNWEFEPVKRTTRVADGALDVAAEKPARLSLPVQWGRYRLEVSNGAQTLTSLGFDAGFYAESTADTPDLLELALDKPGYAAGESMNVAVTARSAGRLTLDVITDRLVESRSQEVAAGTAKVSIPVDANWGTGAYLVATLRRPLDEKAERMPGRAIGVQWFSIGRAAHTLKVDLAPPQTMRPNGKLTVPVAIGGLAPNEDARVVLAAVDVGILNLTNYKPPAPDDYYLGQRRLTAEIRDLYGQLIDGMQGARGQIRSGGDVGAASLTGSPPAQAPLALYSGIVTVGADGKASVDFDIPAFAGTVRVMAVAWSKDKVGKAARDVIVRDPVVLTATLPRFLRSGDVGAVQLELDNVEGAAGEYALALRADGPLIFAGDAARKVTLAAKQRTHVSLPLTAAAASGAGGVEVSVTGPGDFKLTRQYALDVRPPSQTLTRRTVKRLAPGESFTLDKSLLADFVAGTGKAGLSVAVSSSLDAATLFNALDRYPFACSEQLTSIAMAMLYMKDLAGEARIGDAGEIETRVRDAIPRLLARQASNGSFGLWSVGGEDLWLDAYVTDFLTRARERGFDVPQSAFTLALDRLRNGLATAPEPSKTGGRELAYVLYVLARNGAAPIGDLRYDADVQLGDFATPIAKAQIAAALAMMGDRPRADRAFAAALEALAKDAGDLAREDYGSPLRDAAAVVTLASESRAAQRTVDDAVLRIDAARKDFAATSTQENAWLVLAARALAKETNVIALDLGGAAHKGAYYRALSADALAAPLTLANAGAGAVQMVVSVSGSPLKPEPAAGQGFKLERKFYSLDGEPADPAHAKQNDRFAVVLTVTEQQPQFGRVILADYLPAGFEIDNPHFVSSGDTGTLGWIQNGIQPVHTEFRDDRFTAAFDRAKDAAPVFTAAYVVRAVSPGRYVLPQASVEDMYRPDRFARTGTGAIEVTAAK
jgi:uncharacterized protein YfaS (alpha-2-macroglobulin family)